MLNLLGDIWFTDRALRRASPNGSACFGIPRPSFTSMARPSRDAAARWACDLSRRERRRRARDGARDQARARHSWCRRTLSARRTKAQRRDESCNSRNPQSRRCGPLQGIRVLDLTRLLPGPVCTLYLADLGADVIKVEDTGPGDYARNLGNRPGTILGVLPRREPQQAQHRARPQGRAGTRRFPRARARAPMSIVESFRPGVVAALGVGYDTVAAINPRIVYAAISGYGQSGPRAHLARTRHQLPWLRRRAEPDGRARCPTRTVQSADRRSPRWRGIGGDRASRRARRRATDRPRALRRCGDDRCIARAQHLRAARARAMGARFAAGHGPAHGRRAVLRNLPDA